MVRGDSDGQVGFVGFGGSDNFNRNNHLKKRWFDVWILGIKKPRALSSTGHRHI